MVQINGWARTHTHTYYFCLLKVGSVEIYTVSDSFLCTDIICAIRFPFLFEEWLHCGHLKGFSPVWIIVCRRRLEESVKILPQYLQLKVLTPSAAGLGLIKSLQRELTPLRPTSSMRLLPGSLRSPCNKDDLLWALLTIPPFGNQHAQLNIHNYFKNKIIYLSIPYEEQTQTRNPAAATAMPGKKRFPDWFTHGLSEIIHPNCILTLKMTLRGYWQFYRPSRCISMFIHHMDCHVSFSVSTVWTIRALERFLTSVYQKVALQVGAKDKSLRATWALMPSRVWVYHSSVPLQWIINSINCCTLKNTTMKKE